MGGRLFGLPRMPRDQYLEVDARVRSVLTRELGPEGVSWRVPRWLGDKQDFGDMDVLVDPGRVGADSWPTLRRKIAGELMGLSKSERMRVESLRPAGDPACRLGRSNEPVVTQHPEPCALGSAFSFPVDGLQVDLITVKKPSSLTAAWSFMCFNDCGNLLGRLARRLDTKLGDAGLSWVFRGDEHAQPRELQLTDDWDRILLRFLGLDPAPWHDGFSSRERMFDWIVSSPFFDPAPYLPGARAASVIKRSGGRSTVAAFCDWVQARAGVFRAPEPVPMRKTPESWARLDSFFPHAGVALHQARWQAEHERARALGRALSGARVMELTGLCDRALGQFLARCRADLVPGGREAVERFLLSSQPEQVDDAVLALWAAASQPCQQGPTSGTVGS